MNRAKNGSTAKLREMKLVEILNYSLTKNNNLIKKLANDWKIRVEDIDTFSADGCGGMGKHHDLIMKMKDGSIKTIEHKGFCENMDDDTDVIPWKHTPQIFNGSYSFLGSSTAYSKYFYMKVLPKFKTEWPELPDIPSYDDWIKYDCGSMVGTKSEWGLKMKEIRGKCRENDKKIKDICHENVSLYWNIISQKIKSRKPEFIKMLIKDQTLIFEKMTDVLNKKDYWINCQYETTKHINPKKIKFHITPKITNLKIKAIDMKKKKQPTLVLSYNLSSNPEREFVGIALMRWRNGTGIANLGWNVK